MEDYPAAHSMDTEWYAMDARGCVAIFSSGENGTVPHQAGPDVGGIWDLWCLLEPSADRDNEDQWSAVWADVAGSAAKLGAFSYDYGLDFDPIGTYRRECLPSRPLHIDQLPLYVRECCRCVRFASLSFAETEIIQPLELFTCEYWDASNRVAYLASDQKTVRPIPGHEHEFVAFCEALRQTDPKLAETLCFEGLASPPALKRRRRRKKRGSEGA